MSLLKNLASDASIANETDSVGGTRVLSSALYNLKVTLAYIKVAASGAMALELVFKTDTSADVRQTLWMTGGKDKGGKNYYEKDGQKHYLPGFLLANSLSLLTVGKELSELDTEEKVVKLYSYEAKAEVPTKVQMVTDLLGQEIVAGVLRQTVDKTKKNDATGKYEPTGETRDENEIDKFFRARDKLTTAEIRAGLTEASFATTWEEKWKDQVRDRSTKKTGAGTAGAPKASGAAGATAAKTSLFA